MGLHFSSSFEPRGKQTATCKPLYLDLNVPEKTHSVLIKSGKDPQGEGDNFWEKYSKTSDGRTLKTKDITFQFKPVGGEGTVEGLALKPDPNSLFGFVASFTCKDNAKQLCCPEKNKALEFLVHVGIKAPEVKAGGDVAVFHVKVETDEKGRPSFDWEDCKGKLTESGCLETRRRRLLVAAGLGRSPMC